MDFFFIIYNFSHWCICFILERKDRKNPAHFINEREKFSVNDSKDTKRMVLFIQGALDIDLDFERQKLGDY
jgi:hypothetical protein